MSDELLVTQTPAAPFSQVTQVRVPLDEAADAFTARDASGRIPVVVIPSRPNRIRNEFVALGALVLGVAIGELVLLRSAVLLPWAIPLALVLIVLGLYRSFMVRIPEGVDGLLTRGGRYTRTIGSGTTWVPPWYVVSHLVTRRRIPFDVPVVEAPTKDNVRAAVDTLITFHIADPYKFVYSISADDFDEVLQAVCQDGLRALVRRISSEELIDLAQQNLDDLRTRLTEGVAPYGAAVSQVTITYAQPPAAFMASLEARRLAAVQLTEQAEKQALAQRRQADAELLMQQEVATRTRIEELQAQADELRLARMEARLKSYPLAAQYEWESAQLEVARALAGNSRAILQVGDAGDIARALVLSELMRFAPEQAEGDGDGAARADELVLTEQTPPALETAVETTDVPAPAPAEAPATRSRRRRRTAEE